MTGCSWTRWKRVRPVLEQGRRRARAARGGESAAEGEVLIDPQTLRTTLPQVAREREQKRDRAHVAGRPHGNARGRSSGSSRTGCANDAIAAKLYISPQTVQTHVETSWGNSACTPSSKPSPSPIDTARSPSSDPLTSPHETFPYDFRPRVVTLGRQRVGSPQSNQRHSFTSRRKALGFLPAHPPSHPLLHEIARSPISLAAHLRPRPGHRHLPCQSGRRPRARKRFEEVWHGQDHRMTGGGRRS